MVSDVTEQILNEPAGSRPRLLPAGAAVLDQRVSISAGVPHSFQVNNDDCSGTAYPKGTAETFTAPPESKLLGQRKEAASSSFCPFAPVESFLVAKVSIGESRCCGDIDRVVT